VLANPAPPGNNPLMLLSFATFCDTLAQAAPNAGQDRTMLIWAVVAFGLALLLLVVEAFMPSGGVIGALAGVCAIVGIVLFFRFDTTWGLASMAVTLLALPFLIAGLIWVWPNTIVGRALTLNDEQKPVRSEDGGPEEGTIVVGLEGTAETDLRPVGACRLNGRRVDCFAVAGVIEAGTAVRVWAVQGGTIKVKPVTPPQG
jgi:membrane-bound ClpP family serine protease